MYISHYLVGQAFFFRCVKPAQSIAEEIPLRLGKARYLFILLITISFFECIEAKQHSSVLEGLSPREVQVLRMVAEGKTSKEIANLLDLREQTVRSYRKTMMKKLGINNVAGLTQLALSSGLTQLASGAHD